MTELTDTKKEAKQSNSRWWEFYVVRYALGTVFGALIVNMLAKSGLAIPFPNGSIDELTKPDRLPLLIGYGLAYCYLASAPILVFHSARFSMPKIGFRNKTLWVISLPFVAASVWGYYAIATIDSVAMIVLAALAILLVGFIFISQVLALHYGMSRTNEMWCFYLKLDKNRRVQENKELIDSYKHLREHGNAFFVLCLEILFGLGIYVAGTVSLFPPKYLVNTACKATDGACIIPLSTGLIQMVALLLIWIVPAAFVWSIGCFLEREFANDLSIGPVSSVTVCTNSAASVVGTSAVATTSTDSISKSRKYLALKLHSFANKISSGN